MAPQQEIKEEGRRGRPEGTKETPYNLVKQDLSATLKLQKEIRDLVRDQVDRIKKELSVGELELSIRLKAMEMLSSVLDILSKSSKETAKVILDPKGGEGKASQDQVSEEQLMMELVNGVRR